MERNTGLRGCSRLRNIIISPGSFDYFKPTVRKITLHVAAKMRAAIRTCSLEPVTIESLSLAVSETVAAMAAKCPPPDRDYSQVHITRADEDEGCLRVHTYSRNGLPNFILPCLYKMKKPPKNINILQRRALVSAAVPLIIAMAIDDGRLPPFNPTCEQ